jgi:hypothetical protein
MEYMLLIYHNEEEAKARPDSVKQQIFQEFMAFRQDILKSGKHKAGGPLEFTPTAATVRVRNGKTIVTDGPFAETKEQLAGYYILECQDLDEAIAWAAKIPKACRGTKGCVEIRPLAEFPAVPDSFRKSKAAQTSVF